MSLCPNATDPVTQSVFDLGPLRYITSDSAYKGNDMKTSCASWGSNFHTVSFVNEVEFLNLINITEGKQ